MWSFLARATRGLQDEVLPSTNVINDKMTSSEEKWKVNEDKDELLHPKTSHLSNVVEDDIVEHNEEEDWRSFRDEGFLDQTKLHKREMGALKERIQELERELYEYQYHMGLLLIEKEERDSRYEKLRQELVETTQNQKRMQAKHLIVLSQFQNQEENMRKSMSFQKQKIINLEKALNETNAENKEIKLTHEKKLGEIHALKDEIEEKYMGIRAKSHSLNANLAEASRKSSEIDRRFDDVQVQERKLQKESSFLIVKKKQLEDDIVSHKDYLYAWEQKLQDRWKKLVEGQNLLSERESRANERDMILKKKEDEFNEACKRLENVNVSFRLQEDDIFVRLNALDYKQKKVITKQELLDEKENELPSIEEQLNTRERAQSYTQSDDHNPIYEAQKNDLEIETTKNTTLNVIKNDKEFGVSRNDITFENKENKIFEIESDHERKMEHLKDKENQNEMILDVSKESNSLQAKDLKKRKQEFEKERELLNEQNLMIETTIVPFSYNKEKFEIQQYIEEERLRRNKLENNYITGQSSGKNYQAKVVQNLDEKINDICNENMVGFNNHTILKLKNQQKMIISQPGIEKENDMPTTVGTYFPINDIFDHGSDVESSRTIKVDSSVGTQRTPYKASDQFTQSEISYKEDHQEICMEKTNSFTNDQVSHNSSLKRTFSHVSKTLEAGDIEDYETSKSLSDDYEASNFSEDYEASESLSEDYEVFESLSSVQCEEGTENFSSKIEVPGLRRYNFRHSTIVRAVAVAESLADPSKRKKSDKWHQNENGISNISTDDTNETHNTTPSHKFTQVEIEPLNKLVASRDLSPNNMQVALSDGVKQVVKHDNKGDNFVVPLENQEQS